MSEIVVSSSSNSDDKAIDEYHDSSFSGSSTSSSNSSSRGNTTDKQYTSGVPGVPLEVFQDEMRRTMAFRSLVGISTSAHLSASSSEEETVYCYVVGIPSSTDEKKLNSLRSWYQIPNDLNPHLANHGEWCCNLHFWGRYL